MDHGLLALWYLLKHVQFDIRFLFPLLTICVSTLSLLNVSNSMCPIFC